MSLNLFIFFVFVFSSMTILSSIVDNNMGLQTTSLTATLTKTDTTMNVKTTAPFPSATGTVVVEAETICYGGTTATTFTNLTRGGDCRKGATASAHLSGKQVMADAPGVINTLVGFNLVEAFSGGGLTGFFTGAFTSVRSLPQFVGAIGKMLTWDYSFLTGSFVYIKYLILYPLSAGMVLSLVRMALGR